MPAIYLSTGKTAGDEVSSTYEGRHITLEESYLTHPYHADGFVDKGDPVLIGENIVGVAFASAVAATDLIAIDTEGIWFLNVLGSISDGTADGVAHTLAAGDQVFINRTAGTVGAPYMLSGQSDPHNFVPFGYLLGGVTAHLTTPTLVAVKVHNDMSWKNHTFGQYHGVFGDNAEMDMVALKAGGQTQPAWLGAFIRPSTILTAGDILCGIKIRLEDTLASTGGDLQGIRVQVHANKADCNLDRVYGAYLAIANTLSATINESIGLAIAMGGAGTAPAMQTAIQIMGDGTLGTLQGWFQTEIGRGAGLKADATSINVNRAFEIPILIDGVRYCIPVIAWV